MKAANGRGRRAGPAAARKTAANSGDGRSEDNEPIYKTKRMHTVAGCANGIFSSSTAPACCWASAFPWGSDPARALLWGLIPGRDLGRASAYLREVMQTVNENYVDPDAAAYDKLARNAMHGMVESLDPHSQYMESQDNSDLEEDLSGEFGGVGINVEIHAGRIQVIAPIAGSPGDRAGIHHGDEITSIDGRPVATPATMDEVVTRLRGKPKTSVAVGLFRPATGQNLKLTLVREIIKVDSVVGARVLGDGVGYLAITEFSEHTGEQFDHALDGLLKQNIGSLIIDLRNNPGGLLDAAVDVSEPFFRKGELIVYTQGRKPSDREDFRADADGDPLTLPLAVLINSDTASAAEIVTGALKDTGRAVIVGERSFGKGSVQSIFKLKSGEGLRLTMAHYYTPRAASPFTARASRRAGRSRDDDGRGQPARASRSAAGPT